MFEERVGTAFHEIAPPAGSSTGWREVKELLYLLDPDAEVAEGAQEKLELDSASPPGALRERGTDVSTRIGTLLT